MATQHTAASLAFDIIGRNKDKIQSVKFAPSGDKAEAVRQFMGRAVTAELFISAKQAEFLSNLIGDAGVITHGTGDQKFGAFVKDIFSAKKNQTYYLLTFCGFVPQPEVATRDEVADTHADAKTAQQKADDFAACLIRKAAEQKRVQDEGEYSMTWLSKAQADALTANIKGAVKPDGSFITQACGCFCYWGKKRTATGAMLLCWMGEPEDTPVVESAPKGIVPTGKRIPLDSAIPF